MRSIVAAVYYFAHIHHVMEIFTCRNAFLKTDSDFTVEYNENIPSKG